MFMQAFKQAFGVLAKKPLRLWGLSLLCTYLGLVAPILSFPMPIIGIAFALVLSVGMANVYLDGLDGKQVYSDQLFAGTKSFFRNAGGMSWSYIWISIWSVAGIGITSALVLVFQLLIGWVSPKVNGIAYLAATFIGLLITAIIYIYKSYSYAFVPHILATQPEVNATEALRVSKKLTRGKILHMILADLICGFGVGIVTGIMYGITYAVREVKFLNTLFALIFFVYLLLLCLFLPIFVGLYRAAFYKMPKAESNFENKLYDRIGNMAQPQYQAPQQPQYQAPQYQQAPQQPQYQAPQQTQYQNTQQTQYQAPPQNYQQ